MRKLNPTELRKRKAYLIKLAKPIKTIKEIKRECAEITKQALKKINKLETQRQRDKLKEILMNNLELLNTINKGNKNKIHEIFKKIEKETK